ncbi:hypothetical protein OE88DRAFT_1661050 [Heliocybe sulcata]|uniref:Uncharacterized protein n=1 Tax=Heliocybe sulcata TaxID=5364 RepID=A0A5C3MYJ7_9AGAM|nr:hypothetical protein OE88DRAFT_1661050 [Heliocybe sulcata]
MSSDTVPPGRAPAKPATNLGRTAPGAPKRPAAPTKSSPSKRRPAYMLHPSALQMTPVKVLRVPSFVNGLKTEIPEYFKAGQLGVDFDACVQDFESAFDDDDEGDDEELCLPRLPKALETVIKPANLANNTTVSEAKSSESGAAAEATKA